MASVNFMKVKSAGEAKAMLRHCDIDKRKTENHSNLDIQSALSYKNLQIFDYETACNRFDERINELDRTTNTNRRKDRVVMFMLETAVPKDLAGTERAKKWADDAYKIIAKTYGFENVVGVYYHADEVHEYVNENNQRETSREHLHLGVIPEIDGILNGKQFSSRSAMTHINNALQKMTQEKYNCAYMDGSKRKSKKDVEQLKNESAEREAKAKVADMLKRVNAKAEQIERLQAAELERFEADLQPSTPFEKWANEKRIKVNGVSKSIYEVYMDSVKRNAREQVKQMQSDYHTSVDGLLEQLKQSDDEFSV